MAKVISQETFDEVVKENILDFSMPPEEAKIETISQFEAQGVNLTNIIKDLSINEATGKPILNEALDCLKCHVSGDKRLEESELIKQLKLLETECLKSVPHKVLASKNGAKEAIVAILEENVSHEDKKDVLLSCVSAGKALFNKQPDIFDAETLRVMAKILKDKSDRDLLCGCLQWLSKVCILHEINRQNIVDAEIMNCLKPLVLTKDQQVVRDVCTVFRHLVLDDDIRVEFGKAHEHARVIANDVIVELTKLLSEYDDVNILCDLLLTIASLAVRHEFCLAIEEAGGLEYLFDIIIKFPESLKLNREALKLIRALAGHDGVKRNIIKKGAAPIIQSILTTHQANESLATAALVCISTLTLRVKENSAAFFETGIAETITEAMRLHPTNKTIQRNAAWAIRNMVSRSREQCDIFLSFGVEELLNTAMKEFPEINQDIKAALRDLGCKVELKEEWTGKSKIKISN